MVPLVVPNLSLCIGSPFFSRNRPYQHEQELGETRTLNIILVGTMFAYYYIGDAIIPSFVVFHRAPLPRLLCRGRPRRRVMRYSCWC